MPADLSSPIPAALAHLIQTDPHELQDAEAPHLLAYLAAVPDPRASRGRRHRLVAILTMAAAAVLAGARSIAAIAEWAADTPQPVRAALGARRAAPEQFAVPAEATIRRALARLDADALAGAIGAWLVDRQGHDRGDGAGRDQRQRPRQRAVAVDGKTLRGAYPPHGDGRPVHLLACMDHTSRTVLAQRQVGGAPEEVPAFAPLLAGLDLAGVVVTADALHTHPDAAEFLVTRKQAHYLFTVKANQPTLLARCQRLPWHRVPVLDRTRDQAHGRIEHRTLKVVTVHRFGFPHAAQVLQITRKRTVGVPHASTRRRQWRIMTVYAITSLGFAQASPARLADLVRGHWAIEAVHHLRDVTFAEDGSQVRTGAGPSVMACLRNLVIGMLSRAGPVNLAAALRHHARDPARPLATLGIPSGAATHERTLRENVGALRQHHGALADRQNPVSGSVSRQRCAPGRDELCEPTSLRTSPADVSPIGNSGFSSEQDPSRWSEV
jgi:predicted transposase YbfD/YdcC